MQMRVLSTRTMAEDDVKHKNNDRKTVLSTRTMKMRVLSTRTSQMMFLTTRTMPNEGAKHKHNGRRR